ncbi:MAG: SCO family protein [Rhizobiales bacterium]|nr:SCO family protein [Hyphomicrobiales bacterium]
MNSASNTEGLRRIRRLLWAAVAGSALALGSAVLWRALIPSDLPAPRVTGEAAIINAYTLTDHTGRLVTADSFDGQWQLVFFGFTFCPDICPTTLAYMASVMDILGPQADRLAPIFVTVDPARDTVEIMAEYVAAFHPQLIGLTGTEAQIDEAAGNFRVWYERSEHSTAPDGYLMAHSGYIYLMRPDGGFDSVYREGDQPPEALADEIFMRIERDERS